MTTNCLLCNSADTQAIAEIDAKKIVSRYLRTYKADFSYLFTAPEISLIECKSCKLLFYSPQVSGDEHFYAVLQKTPNYYRENKEEYNFASQIIAKGSSVLDVGCGKGEFKRFVPGSNFTGLEFSPEAIKSGTENGCHILNQSIEEHAIQNANKYDYVTAFQVLEHVTDISSFIRACADCVMPGGKLIIAVPSEESYLRLSPNAILNMPPHHISRWTDKALINMADFINFTMPQIHHDKLDALHIDSFYAALIERALPFKNNNGFRIIDNTISYKIRIKLAGLLAKRFSKAGSDTAWQGIGQNVTAVYQKPLQAKT